MLSPKDEILSVMTWNIYLGADLTPLLAADPNNLNERIDFILINSNVNQLFIKIY